MSSAERSERDYAHRSLIEKLGVTFYKLVAKHVHTPPATTLRGRYDVIVYEVNAPRDLEHIVRLAEHLVSSGGLWILHPKGKGASPHDAEVRAAGIAAAHTATRYVMPRARR